MVEQNAAHLASRRGPLEIPVISGRSRPVWALETSLCPNVRFQRMHDRRVENLLPAHRTCNGKRGNSTKADLWQQRR
jgi:hypothetical protein